MISLFLCAVAMLFVLVPVYQNAPKADENSNSTVQLRLMETTDIHSHVVNYNYYQDKQTSEFGLALTATLIEQARSETANTILFDNGDLIQGNPLASYISKQGLEEGDVHPVYKAMNQLDYAAGNIGNHEFNYGIEFLQEAIDDANFPYINANVYVDDGDDNPANDENFFTPYKIIPKKVTDEAGNEHTVDIGVIGFVPPQIMQWDKANLEGKVIAKDIYKTAQKFVPQMVKEGADIVVAIPHSGVGTPEITEKEENAVYDLTKIPGIDAILFGHSHLIFPSDDFAGLENVNLEKGTINGVPSVEAGMWGDHLGIVDLTLQKDGEDWDVIDSKSEARPIYNSETGEPLVEPDQDILDAVQGDHQSTLEYIRGQVGETTAPIYSYFARVKDDPSVQIVSDAQTWYTEKIVQGTEYEGMPILSAAAPFKAGGRGGADYYTYIPEGPIAIKNVADLYVYPNTLKVVKLNGAQVREWLEMSAGQFNRIDPNTTEEQSLINTSFAAYNFDVIDGVTYEIDVTNPQRYSDDGELINPDSHRIVNLQFNGEPIDEDQAFLIATNNYRASGGGNFPHLDGSNIVLSPQIENRQAVIDYIKNNVTIDPSADDNWTYAPVDGNVQATFNSSPEARQLIDEQGNISFVGEAADGFVKYAMDLSAPDEEDPEPSVNSLRTLVDGYIESGDIKHPLAVQLTNKLRQAEHQLEKGHTKQATKKMQDFLKHLNKPSMEKFISNNAKKDLNKQANALIEAWENKDLNK